MQRAQRAQQQALQHAQQQARHAQQQVLQAQWQQTGLQHLRRAQSAMPPTVPSSLHDASLASASSLPPQPVEAVLPVQAPAPAVATPVPPISVTSAIALQDFWLQQTSDPVLPANSLPMISSMPVQNSRDAAWNSIRLMQNPPDFAWQNGPAPTHSHTNTVSMLSSRNVFAVEAQNHGQAMMQLDLPDRDLGLDSLDIPDISMENLESIDSDCLF